MDSVDRPRTGREQAERRAEEESRLYSGECEVCGYKMYGLHCKIICPNCGYRRDCSDP